MLYVDSSVLVKCYVQERGSDAALARLQSGERVFTAVLAYFEVLAALGRRVREHLLKPTEYQLARDNFRYDWLFSLNRIDLDARLMAGVDELILQYPLRGADAVHLSAALWVRDAGFGGVELQFGVADNRLKAVAVKCGFAIFDPETVPNAGA